MTDMRSSTESNSQRSKRVCRKRSTPRLCKKMTGRVLILTAWPSRTSSFRYWLARLRETMIELAMWAVVKGASEEKSSVRVAASK